MRGANEIEWWGLAQDWVKDIRPSRRSYGEPVIERLKEIRAERVGVIGLAGLVRAPEGSCLGALLKRSARRYRL